MNDDAAINGPKTEVINRPSNYGTSKPPDDPLVVKTDEFGDRIDGTPLKDDGIQRDGYDLPIEGEKTDSKQPQKAGCKT
jgi:hypothetical protein